MLSGSVVLMFALPRTTVAPSVIDSVLVVMTGLSLTPVNVPIVTVDGPLDKLPSLTVS